MFDYFFSQSKEYNSIKSSVKERISPIYIDGINDSVFNVLMSRLQNDLDRTIFVFTESEKKAQELYNICSYISDECLFLPCKEIVYFDTFSHSKDNEIARIEVLLKAMNHSKVVFSSIENLLVKYPSKDLLKQSMIKIVSEDVIDNEVFINKMFSLGYEKTEFTEAKGQFSIRGGIIDVFSPLSDYPVRIELFDDEVDAMRTFDCVTQKSIENVFETFIYPAREAIIPMDDIEGIIESIKNVNTSMLNDSAKESYDNMLESIKGHVYYDALYKYHPLFQEVSSSLLEYGKDTISTFMQSTTLLQSLKSSYNHFLMKIDDYFEKGYILAEQGSVYYQVDYVLEMLLNYEVIICDYLIKNMDNFKIEQIFKLEIREVNKYFGNIEALSQDIKRWSMSGNRIVLSLDSQNSLRKLKEDLSQYDIFPLAIDQLGNNSSGVIVADELGLPRGFQLNTFKLIVLTGQEIYNAKKKRKKQNKSKQGQFVKSYTDLKVGDYVVHENHGVGIYHGVQRLTVDKTKKDYMKISYSGEDTLYIPVENSELIQKYIGPERGKMKVNKLNSTEWKKTKLKAKKVIEDMTDELLELYAKRQQKPGYAFSNDGEWQRDFESLFPYEETRDQLKCIEEIKKDMQLERPMERLLCGDVGFGKTEVALRAAFKAVADSKQVAILVPTTILAQQHYTNIISRFSKFPIKIEMMSRFRTKKQQSEIAEKVRKGQVDIIVGTHRILSEDVKFKDLGLLIIDEEQRFGVKHKEKIKMLKENIDVLTLTATPIPRTLHMSLIGIRDMSVIEDPPEDRYPIQTYVMQEDDYIIKECIQRELDRNGQVFFVHNRVGDIDQVAAKISKLNPEADVRFAHGQMSEVKLEKMMMAFLNHEFDVLVCTTIIETGLDISNVNTIIINDGDRLGLSQLYQLRGRVGRSNRLAYCYVLYKKDKILSEVAEKRMVAIKEFTELGSGFKIAMRDLEIRGTGNILGAQQHGQMDAIGYDLYCKLLEESIRKRRGEEIISKVETKIEFKVDAYVPNQYIFNDNAKIDLYNKISGLETRDDMMSLQDELEDRFGKIPRPLNNLMKVSYIKNMLEVMGFDLMYQQGQRVYFRFDKNTKLDPKFLSDVLTLKQFKVEFKSGEASLLSCRVTGILNNKEEILKNVELFVEKIYSHFKENKNRE